jgi:hypothetical protein
MAFNYEEVRADEQADDVEITEKPKTKNNVTRILHWFLHAILLSTVLTLSIWRSTKMRPDNSAGAGFQRIHCEYSYSIYLLSQVDSS